MEYLEKLKEICRILEYNENKSLAKLLENILDRNDKRDLKTIGFVGENLVGKSTFINSILGEKILPTAIIPATADITLEYGPEFVIYDKNRNIITDRTIEELELEEEILFVETNNSYLKKNKLIFKEFHGLFSKEKLNDIDLMLDVYKCDKVVLVLTAEQFLSEIECLFIRNYIKYVGAENILLVVNRLSFIAESDTESVLDYAKDKLRVKFPEIKWTVFEPNDKYIDLLKKYSKNNIMDEIEKLFSLEKKDDSRVLRNILEYVKGQLEYQKNELEILDGKDREELEEIKDQIRRQKERDRLAVETAIVEFIEKRNNTIDAVDSFIKEQFDNILESIDKEYKSASNKYIWSENRLKEIWESSVKKAAKKVDEYVAVRMDKDIKWLNDVFKTELGMKTLAMNVVETDLVDDKNRIDYGKYKKYAVIGAAGGILLGFCLFRIVGAIVAVAGDLLAYLYIELRDSTQNEEIQSRINSKIKEVSYEVRKISRQDIEEIYAELQKEFKRETEEILDVKYSIEKTTESQYKDKINKINNLIKKIEEI